MLIGCIADTHIPTRAKRIPDEVMEAFQGVDAIFHCGDMVKLEALEQKISADGMPLMLSVPEYLKRL